MSKHTLLFKNITKFTNININISNVTLILFYITIFLLPSNLFRIWRPEWSYIDGHFIDYLAPKLYLSQLSIWLLWVITLGKNGVATRGKAFLPSQFRFKTSLLPSAFIFLGIFGVVGSIQALLLQDWSLFFWIANFLSGPVLFGMWCWWQWPQITKHIIPAVLLSCFFQAGLAWWQWVHQRSFANYLFLGEPDLSSPGVAISSISQQMLRLPYGTTPHPNILAAWLLLGISSFILIYKGKKNLSSLFVLFLLSFSFWLTESWSAWLSLPLLSWHFWKGPLFFSRIWARPKIKILTLLLVLSASLLVLPFLTQLTLRIPFTESASLTRRSHLQTVALNDLFSSPGGIGLQRSFQTVKAAETTYQGTRFLQPVHHTGLFLPLSLGLWVYLLLLFFIYKEQKYYSFYFLLILFLLPIFYLDHYLLSTISGQYWLTIFFLLFIKSYNNNMSHNL